MFVPRSGAGSPRPYEHAEARDASWGLLMAKLLDLYARGTPAPRCDGNRDAHGGIPGFDALRESPWTAQPLVRRLVKTTAGVGLLLAAMVCGLVLGTAPAAAGSTGCTAVNAGYWNTTDGILGTAYEYSQNFGPQVSGLTFVPGDKITVETIYLGEDGALNLVTDFVANGVTVLSYTQINDPEAPKQFANYTFTSLNSGGLTQGYATYGAPRAEVALTFTCAPGPAVSQTISFTSTAPSNAKVGGSTYTPAATATSGLTVVFTIAAASSSVCAISGGVVSFIGPGTCTIDANQAGDSNYAAATQVTQAFTVAGDAVTSIAPSSGAIGTGVAIIGTGFTDATAVHFGAASALFTFTDDSHVTATVPAGSGTVDVTVTTPIATSATSAADRFTYVMTLAATASSTTQVGQSYSQANVASGGTTPYTYSVFAGLLPAGTTLNTSTGLVSGTPTAPGAFSYAIKVTDSGGPQQTATQVTNGTIAPATLTLVATASNTTQVGQAYSQSNVANGGTTPYVYSLFAGTLPAGTTLNASTGTVSGTPTAAGAFSYTIEATDGGSPTPQTATQVVSGTIAPAILTPTVTSVSPNGGPPGGGTSVTITGTDLAGATAVTFGGAAAAQFAVNGATSITAVSPRGAIGAVDVTVTTGNGTSATSAADRFTYASPQSTQQGVKLIGTGFSGAADEGYALALSSDGNTALIGGYNDNAGVGGFWIFNRSGTTWTQAGGKLTGTGNVGAANEGWSVALSGDGNTAIVGGDQDNTGIGAAWVFTQSGGVWTQQAELTASDETGAGAFGFAVALSSDGNTALIGGDADNSNVGATWVFARNGNSWAQVGSKLIGTGAAGGTPQQGSAVALSSNATTALIGGFGDNANVGAVWVFAQSGGVWSQAGTKLTAGDEAGAGVFGAALALSADGNTALIGGYGDNADTGAAWVFTQSGGVWSQVGSKLIGTGAAGTARQGFAVALSGDAGTAAIGGPEDNSFNGATWVFTQSGGSWTQRGSKLTGTGAIGAAEQGLAVALSSDGTTLIAGGAFDNTGTGAAWVFIPSGKSVAHDFNGDGKSDILWRDSNSGLVAIWEMNGSAALASFGVGAETANWQIVGTGDFNGDHHSDILWRDANTGTVAIWEMNGSAVIASLGIGGVASNWQVVGTGDFNGDGYSDILWRDSNTGMVAIWEMNGSTVIASFGIGAEPSNWQIVGTGDFNGDGYSDILWRDSTTGTVAIWEMNGRAVIAAFGIGGETANWQIAGTGDFNGDGYSDILWRDANTGTVAIWEMNGSAVIASLGVGGETANWQIAQTGDFDGDGKSDILWRDSVSGTVAIWQMNGSAVAASSGIGGETSNWQIQSLNTD